MEILGVLASIMVLVSFLFNNEKQIRKINIFGALLFVIYGIAIDAFSVYLLNSLLILIHIYYLKKIND